MANALPACAAASAGPLLHCLHTSSRTASRPEGMRSCREPSADTLDAAVVAAVRADELAVVGMHTIQGMR